MTDEASGMPDERAGFDVEALLADEPMPEFDPQWRSAFEGLCYIGKLRREFDAYGHPVVIRTMVTDEVLEVGLLSAPYIGTLGEMKAYQAALVAGCVVSIDGKPLPMPLTDVEGDTPLANRFNYVKSHWFSPVLDRVYQEYLLLEVQVDMVMKSLGEASG